MSKWVGQWVEVSGKGGSDRKSEGESQGDGVARDRIAGEEGIAGDVLQL